MIRQLLLDLIFRSCMFKTIVPACTAVLLKAHLGTLDCKAHLRVDPSPFQSVHLEEERYHKLPNIATQFLWIQSFFLAGGLFLVLLLFMCNGAFCIT